MGIIKKYMQCRRVIIIFLLLFIIVAVRGISALYVEKTGSQNFLLQKIIEGITIQSANYDDKWSTEYPYQRNALEAYSNRVSAWEDSLSAYCTSSFPFRDSIHSVISWYRSNLVKCELNDNAGDYGQAAYVAEAASNVIAFSQFCSEEGIPMVYFSTPCMDSIQYYEGNTDEIANWNIVNRSITLLKGIKSGEVDARCIGEKGVAEGHSFQFDASQHWFPADALYAAKMIADALNSDYGFQFTEGMFESENYYDILAENAPIAEEIQKNCGYMFSYPIPFNHGSYHMSYAEDEQVYDGSFSDTFLRSPDAWNLEGGAYHNMTTITNSLIFDIKNELPECNGNKKILVIGDSFNWPLSAYLSQGVGEIVILHNASFTGSIETYIKCLEPDIVLMVYNDAEFYEVYTQEAFYLQ